MLHTQMRQKWHTSLCALVGDSMRRDACSIRSFAAPTRKPTVSGGHIPRGPRVSMLPSSLCSRSARSPAGGIPRLGVARV